MNRLSDKTANDTRHNRCEWCRDWLKTEEHHIAQGKDRESALNNPACIIHLCRDCHTKIQGIRDCRMIGLAILLVRRPEEFSLSEFWRVTKRRWPGYRDVEQWRKRLTLEESSEEVLSEEMHH